MFHFMKTIISCGPHVPVCSSPSRAKKTYTREVRSVDSIPHAPTCQCWRMPQGGRSPGAKKTYIFVCVVAPFQFNFEIGGPGGTGVRMLAVC